MIRRRVRTLYSVILYGVSCRLIGMAGDMHNRQAITPRRLWNAIRDVDLWPLYLLGLTIYVPMVPMNSYITLILKSIGFDTVYHPSPHSPYPGYR